MRATASVIGLVGLLIPLSIFAIDQGGRAGPCSSQSAVAAIVEAHLPAFALPGPDQATADPCAQVVSGDFNGDGATDLAAVLTEKVAPQRYSDGTAHFSAYVFVFLAAQLPYAGHEAVLLLGHDSVPRRISLQTVTVGSGTRARLIVTNVSYSRTVYEWRPTGFVVVEHKAD